MKYEKILEEWDKDSDIDHTELGSESLKISKLHHKYLEIFRTEKEMLRLLEEEYIKLKKEKYEFYTQGPNEETQAKGWKLPPKGLILKADIPLYMDSDEDILKVTRYIGIQKDKLEALKDINKKIHSRSYDIGRAIEWQKYIMGG